MVGGALGRFKGAHYRKFGWFADIYNGQALVKQNIGIAVADLNARGRSACFQLACLHRGSRIADVKDPQAEILISHIGVIIIAKDPAGIGGDG